MAWRKNVGLLDNFMILLIAAAAVAALVFIGTRHKKGWIFALLASFTELGVVLFLLYRGVALEEVFLMLLIFGAISVTVHSLGNKKRKSDMDTEE